MQYFNQLQDLVRAFNWHSPSWDLFILLFWIVAAVLYAFTAGRGRILAILVAVYMSKLLVLEAPFLSETLASRLNIGSGSIQQLITFGILFLIFFVFLSRYAFKSSVDSRRVSALPFSIAFAILQVGLLINIVVSYLPMTVTANFSPLIHFLFIDPPASFVWLLLPTAFLIILGRFISDRADL
jgi:hypothetical protein